MVWLFGVAWCLGLFIAFKVGFICLDLPSFCLRFAIMVVGLFIVWILMLMLLPCLWFMVRLYLVVDCFRLCFDLRCACVLYLVFWWLWFVVFAGRCEGNSLVVFLVCC